MQALPYVVSLGSIVLLAMLVAGYGWQRRHTPSALALTWLALSVALWVIFYACELSAPDFSTKLWWAKLQYVGIVNTPLAWLIFTQQYTNTQRCLSARTLAALLIIPLLTLGLVWTNDFHQLVWQRVDFSPSDTFPALKMTFGTWFWVHTIYSYLLLAIGSIALVRIAIRTPQRYRRQISMVLLFVLPPWLGNVLYVLHLDPIYPIDLTPFTFAFSFMALGWSLFHFGLLDIVPVAHTAIVSGMHDGVIVIDVQTRVIEINPAAENITAHKAGATFGYLLAQLLPDQPELMQLCQNYTDARIEILLGTAPTQRSYDVQISLLLNSHGLLSGRLLILHDITEHKRVEEAQRFLFEASDLLASSLNHEITIATVARLAIPRVADWCIIHTGDTDQSIPRIALTLTDPSRQHLIDELQRRYPLASDASHRYPHIMRTRQPTLIADVTDTDLAAIAQDDYHLQMLQALGVRSTMSVPLIARGQTIGAIMFGSGPSGRRYNQNDLQLAIELAHRIALAIDNARLFAHLHTSEQRYRTLIAQAADGIVLIDRDGHILDANEHATILFGYTRAELVSIHISALLDLPERVDMQIAFNALQERGQAFMVRCKDQSLCPIEMTAGTFTENEQQVFIMIMRDMSERRNTENRLRRQNEELTALHETTLSLINRQKVDRLLESIVLRAGTLLNTPHGYLYQVDTERKELVLHVATGHFSHQLGYRLAYGRGLAGRVWKTGQALAIDDYRTWSERQTNLDDMGLHAVVNVPIRAGQELVGVLGLAYLDATRTFHADAIALLQRFADMSSLALESARLYSAAQQEIKERRRTEATLRRVQAELRTAKDLAEAATQAKSTFLAYMSHEMRTPISSVIGITDVLARSRLDREQIVLLDVIRTGGNTLLALLNNFLDLAQIEAGKMHLAHQPYQVQQCIEEAIDLVAVKAAEKGLDLAYALDPIIPKELIGDCDRLRQILVNLLGNAIKFTFTGGVFLAVDARSMVNGVCEIHVRVEDTGIGISADQIEAVFVPFQQLGSAPTPPHVGSGLGLAISKQLSELMGGRMWLESNVGIGSTFHVTLVSDVPAAAIDHHAVARDASLNQRMLVVLEQPFTLRALCRYAQARGIQVTTASSARDAFACLDQGSSFDSIVLDFNTYDPDQSALLARVQQAHTPVSVVLLTPLDYLEQLASNVPHVLLHKPLKLSQLQRALARGREPRVITTYAQPAHEQASVIPLRVLLVEDDIPNQQVASLLLQHIGYHIDTATSGSATLAALEREQYDMVLLDLHLPDTDGITLARMIRQRWPIAQQPYLIAVTADTLPATQAQSINNGINDYIIKPITMEALKTALARYHDRAAAVAHAQLFEHARAYGDTSFDATVLERTYETLNIAMVDYLRELFSKQAPEKLMTFFNTYCDDTWLLLRQMHAALFHDDLTAIRQVLHKLKASSAIVGATALMALCEEYEHVGGTSDQASWQIRLHTLEVAFVQVQDALHQEGLHQR